MGLDFQSDSGYSIIKKCTESKDCIVILMNFGFRKIE